MLSNLLDVVGYGGLTFGAFVFGGRGAAGFVGGFCFLLLSYSLSDAPPLFNRVRSVLARRPAEVPLRLPRDPMMYTNEILTDILAQAQDAVLTDDVG